MPQPKPFTFRRLRSHTALGVLLPLMLGLAGTAYATPAKPTAQAASCVSGNWGIVEVENNESVQYQTDHFAFRWKEGTVVMADAVSAGQVLEGIWTEYLTRIAFPMPYCDTAKKFKVNINLDPTFGLAGGPTGDRDMGMWIAPPALKDHWGLAHEFAHALQGSTRSFRDSPYAGWTWESHANWMAHQINEFHKTEVHCSEMLVNYPHLYYGSSRDRYCNWQFFEYIKDTYGYGAVSGIWDKALKTGTDGYLTEDPFSALMRAQGWDIDQLNDVFGNWAMRNVNWDYANGALYRQKYGTYEQREGDRALRVTALDPIDLANRRFAVPSAWAPQRWGYNIVRLIPDAGADKITVSFRGVVQSAAAATLPGLANEPTSVPAPDADWRWGVVIIGADGTSRRSPVVDGSDAEMTLPLKAGDAYVYMMVMATPSSLQKIAWDQAYYSIYRYPWMVELKGAMPQGFEPAAPNPSANGHRHPNGGGWVANGAQVDASAYVSPYARVLGGSVTGNARIEDHAVITGGKISGNAVVGALSVITNGVTVKDNAVVATTFKSIGAFEPGTVIAGTAQVRGDAEVRGGPTLTKGAYTGFVDQNSMTDPKQGADLTAPVPEINADVKPVWE